MCLPVPAEQKTPNAEPPHYLEDEGLYVGERSKVNWTNQVLVENRLLKREDKVRLGADSCIFLAVSNEFDFLIH